MITGEVVDDVVERRSAAVAVRERGEVQRDGPAFGPLNEPGDLLRVGVDVQLAQEHARLRLVERQLGGADLHEASSDAQPAER